MTPHRAGLLADLLLVATLLGLAAILTAALVLEFAFGEKPCPLCLIERIGMFGIGLGLVLHLRGGPSLRAVGSSLLCAVFLLVVSVRQVLLDICPRPGHSYVGSAVLGLHMPVWSVVIAVGVMAALALALVLAGDAAARAGSRPQALTRAARWSGAYLAALSAVNLAAVAL